MAQITGLYRTATTTVMVSTDYQHGIVNTQGVRIVGTSDRAWPAYGTASSVTTGGTATVTTVALVSGTTWRYTTSAAHGFTVGQYVTITGMSNAGNNGSFFVTAVTTTTTFDVTNASGVAATAQTGTAVTLPSLVVTIAATGSAGQNVTSATEPNAAVYPVTAVRPATLVRNDAHTPVGTTSYTTAVNDSSLSTYLTRSASAVGAQVWYQASAVSTSLNTGQYVWLVGGRAQATLPSSTGSSCGLYLLRYYGTSAGPGSTASISGAITAGSAGVANVDWDWLVDGYSTAAANGPVAADDGSGAFWTPTTVNAAYLGWTDSGTTAGRATLYELWTDVVYGVSPYLSSLSPSGPGGTSRPTVSWTHVHPDYLGQVAYQIKVFTTAQANPTTATGAVWDSGTVYSASNSATIGFDLVNGSSYFVYVRTACNPWSQFAYATTSSSLVWAAWGSGTASSFLSWPTVSLTAPTAPTTVAAWQSGSQAFLITSTGASYAGTSQTFTVQRSDDGGTTWATVRNGSGLVPNGSFVTTVTDYEADRDSTQIRYRTRADGINGTSILQSVGTAVTGTPTSDGTWWLKAPLNSSLNRSVVVQAANLQFTRDETLGVFRPYGRSTAVVVSGVLGGKDGSFDIAASGLAAWQALEPLVTAQQTLLVQDPLGDQKYVRITKREYDLEGNASRPVYRVKVDYVEVAAP